jgi:enolase
VEQLRKDVRKNTFFSRDSRAAGLMSVVALIIALFGSSVTLVVSHRSKRTADQTAAALAASINEGRTWRAAGRATRS